MMMMVFGIQRQYEDKYLSSEISNHFYSIKFNLLNKNVKDVLLMNRVNYPKEVMIGGYMHDYYRNLFLIFKEN
jgi:hypothetical protein